MNGNTLAAMNERMRKLESYIWWWHRGSFALLLVVVAGTLAGLASPGDRVVVAERFVLRNAQGEIKAILGEAPIADPEEGLPFTETEKFLAHLGGWGLHLYSSDKEVVRLVEHGQFNINTPDGGAFYVSVSDKTALVQMVNPRDNKELRLQLLPEFGGANISLSSNKTTRVVIGETDLVNSVTETKEHRPLSSIVLFGKDGKVVSTLPR